jgi:hypothetical protein
MCISSWSSGTIGGGGGFVGRRVDAFGGDPFADDALGDGCFGGAPFSGSCGLELVLRLDWLALRFFRGLAID